MQFAGLRGGCCVWMWGQEGVLPALMELFPNRMRKTIYRALKARPGGRVQVICEHTCRVCPHHCTHTAHTLQGLLALSALVRHCAPGMAAFRASGGVPHLVTLCVDADSRVQR